jgi:hypothetical protein
LRRAEVAVSESQPGHCALADPWLMILPSKTLAPAVGAGESW